MGDFLDKGEISLDELNDMNVPVNIRIMSTEDFDAPQDRKWVLTADVYFPRRGRVMGEAVEVYSDDRDALVRRIREVALPLYAAAIRCIEALDKPDADGCSSLYYWEYTRLTLAGFFLHTGTSLLKEAT